MPAKKESIRVHKIILYGMAKIETEEGKKWALTGPDATGCHRYSMQYSDTNVPTKEWTLLITTQSETMRYYFHHKNYDVQLCPGILHLTYTKKESA